MQNGSVNTSIGLDSELMAVNPTISLKYIVTHSNFSGGTMLPDFSESATDLKEVREISFLILL